MRKVNDKKKILDEDDLPEALHTLMAIGDDSMQRK
jgi:predicted metalloprotease